MKKSMQAAAGLAFLVGCGNLPPEDTEPLTDDQRAEVVEDLHRLEYETPLIKRLVRNADTLFTINGKKAKDNKDLLQGIDSVESDLRFYLEQDRFVTTPFEEDRDVEFRAYADGTRSNRVADNYVVLNVMPDDGELMFYTTATYMHEAAHFYYSTNTKEHNHIDDYVAEGRYKSRDEYVLKTRDVSYLMNTLYSIDAAFEKAGKDPVMDEIFDQLPEKVENLIENYTEEEAREVVLSWQRRLQEVLDKSDQEIMEDYWHEFNAYSSYYEYLGITGDEFREAYFSSTELAAYKKEVSREYLAELQERFPEYLTEIDEAGSEIDQELNAETSSETDEEPEFWQEYAEGDNAKTESRSNSESSQEGPRKMW